VKWPFVHTAHRKCALKHLKAMDSLILTPSLIIALITQLSLSYGMLSYHCFRKPKTSYSFDFEADVYYGSSVNQRIVATYISILQGV